MVTIAETRAGISIYGNIRIGTATTYAGRAAKTTTTTTKS
jgi:hypothetical protein